MKKNLKTSERFTPGRRRVVGPIPPRRALLALLALAALLAAGPTRATAENAPAASAPVPEWINGEVFDRDQLILFRADHPVAHNAQGNVLVLGARRDTAKVLMPLYVTAAKQHAQLRLYGVLGPVSDALVRSGIPDLPSVQFITWKVHAPGDPDELPADQKTIIHPGDAMPGWKVELSTPVRRPGGEAPTLKCPSPDGRHALRLTRATDEEYAKRNVGLIEKSTGKVVADLGTANHDHLADTVLVWSADSRRVAYATRDNREGETRVFFRDGADFVEAKLPDDLPGPRLKFRRDASGGVKNYGGGTRPVRWLRSGELELSSDLMMLSRGDGRGYTGVVLFTVGFDAQRHATVRKVSPTKTTVD